MDKPASSTVNPLIRQFYSSAKIKSQAIAWSKDVYKT